jgi:hypothetical protein
LAKANASLITINLIAACTTFYWAKRLFYR